MIRTWRQHNRYTFRSGHKSWPDAGSSGRWVSLSGIGSLEIVLGGANGISSTRGHEWSRTKTLKDRTVELLRCL